MLIRIHAIIGGYCHQGEHDILRRAKGKEKIRRDGLDRGDEVFQKGCYGGGYDASNVATEFIWI